MLLLTDPVDAFWTSAPIDFDGKPLKSLSQGDIDFSLIPLTEEKAEEKKDEAAVDEAMTIAVVKEALGERVADVRASQRLTSSASCLVASGEARDRELERLLAQHDKGVAKKPILEINLQPSAGRGDCGSKGCGQGYLSSCCWSRPRSSTANCRKIRRHSRRGSISSCCAG